jgi:fructosamine-3-kinase
MDAPELRQALEHALGPVSSSRPLGASAFCETWHVRHDGRALFVKTAPTGRSAMLQAEADGLRALAATRTVRVPEVACVLDDAAGCVLAMEWLELLPADAGFGERFGTALAALHGACDDSRLRGFGWTRDNFLGATPQSNTPTADWLAFFGRHRLGAMRDRLRGAAHAALRDAVDAVIERLPRFFDDGYVPSPALVHGDLWPGNWGMLADGSPVVFDPAVSRSDAEAELAMMTLFGGVPAGFTRAYEAAGGVRANARRQRLYQLHQLLNHAVLFGGGYAGQAVACARELARA